MNKKVWYFEKIEGYTLWIKKSGTRYDFYIEKDHFGDLQFLVGFISTEGLEYQFENFKDNLEVGNFHYYLYEVDSRFEDRFDIIFDL